MGASARVVIALIAADPPLRPEPPPVTPNECARTFALEPGKPPPAGLLDARGIVACGAVAVPTSQLADLLSTETWAEYVADRYRLDTAAAALTLADAEARAVHWRTVAEAPPPILQRPAVAWALGSAYTLAAVGVTAWGLSEVGR